MAVEVRGLKNESEYERMLETVGAGFGHEVEVVRRRFERHPPYKLEATRVTIVDGFIVSVVHVHGLRVRGRNGETWLMGGIGEVCTHPDYRRTGYATMALRDSIGYMERVGCQFSMLGTGQNEFYERLGWVTYPRTFLTFDPEQVQLPADDDDLEIREVDWDADLSDLKRIYREYNRDKLGPLIRSEEYWQEATSPRRRSGSSWIACRSGDPVAYLWGAAELRILELPHLEGEEHASKQLLLHALGVAQRDSFKRVVMEAAISSQARKIADQQPEGAVSRSESTNTMLRPVAPGFSIKHRLSLLSAEPSEPTDQPRTSGGPAESGRATDFAPGELIYYATDGF